MPTIINRTIREDGTGDYTSVNAMQAALPASLVAADEMWEVTIEGPWTSSDDTAVTFNNTSDATRFIRITAVSESRAVMPSGSTTHYMHVNTISGISEGFNHTSNTTEYMELHGIAFKVRTTTSGGTEVRGGACTMTSQNCLIDSCLFLIEYDASADNTHASSVMYAGVSNRNGSTTRNCVSHCYILNTGKIPLQGFNNAAATSRTIFCTSVIDSGSYIDNGGGSGRCFRSFQSVASSEYAYCVGSNGDNPASSGVFSIDAGLISGSYNVSDDATASSSLEPGTVSWPNTDLSSTWVDPDNHDFHLTSANTPLNNLVPASSSLGFTHDFDGNTRYNVTLWDVGAIEFFQPIPIYSVTGRLVVTGPVQVT